MMACTDTLNIQQMDFSLLFPGYIFFGDRVLQLLD